MEEAAFSIKAVQLPDGQIIYPNYPPAAQIGQHQQQEFPAENSDGEMDSGASSIPPSSSTTRTFVDSTIENDYYDQITRKIPPDQEYQSIPTYKPKYDIIPDDINRPAISDQITVSLSQVESQPEGSVEMASSTLFSTQPDEVQDPSLVEMNEPVPDENNDIVSRGIRHYHQPAEYRIRGGVLQLAMTNNRSFYKHRARTSRKDRKSGFFPPKPNTKKYLRMW